MVISFRLPLPWSLTTLPRSWQSILVQNCLTLFLGELCPGTEFTSRPGLVGHQIVKLLSERPLSQILAALGFVNALLVQRNVSTLCFSSRFVPSFDRLLRGELEKSR